MKQDISFKINIPNPCNQDWGLMPVAGNGKHCLHCNNIVYDFTQMSDEELFNFFKQQPSTHCGRFYNAQLNREISPAARRKKSILPKFNKVAAAIFTVLSFKAVPLRADNKNDKIAIALDANFKTNNHQYVTDKITISGTIKDAGGKPVEKAIVRFDSVQVAVTDAEGRYSFELPSVSASSHNLYFSYGDLVTVVRNYHPAMLSTSYDIKLYKTENIGTAIVGGIINMEILDLPSLVFKTKEFKLNADHRAMLATVAVKMRLNPVAVITIIGYLPEHNGRPICNRRLDNIKKYLVEKEGIVTDRITLNSEYGGDQNTIDIKSGQ